MSDIHDPKGDPGISPFTKLGRSLVVDDDHDPRGDPGISPFVLVGRVLVDPPTAEETEEARGTSSFSFDPGGDFVFSWRGGSKAWDGLPLPILKR